VSRLWRRTMCRMHWISQFSEAVTSPYHDTNSFTNNFSHFINQLFDLIRYIWCLHIFNYILQNSYIRTFTSCQVLQLSVVYVISAIFLNNQTFGVQIVKKDYVQNALKCIYCFLNMYVLFNQNLLRLTMFEDGEPQDIVNLSRF
jgi:hypothetical protein